MLNLFPTVSSHCTAKEHVTLCTLQLLEWARIFNDMKNLCIQKRCHKKVPLKCGNVLQYLGKHLSHDPYKFDKVFTHKRPNFISPLLAMCTLFESFYFLSGNKIMDIMVTEIVELWQNILPLIIPKNIPVMLMTFCTWICNLQINILCPLS